MIHRIPSSDMLIFQFANCKKLLEGTGSLLSPTIYTRFDGYITSFDGKLPQGSLGSIIANPSAVLVDMFLMSA